MIENLAEPIGEGAFCHLGHGGITQGMHCDRAVFMAAEDLHGDFVYIDFSNKMPKVYNYTGDKE